jgi:beta-lactamase regulating signal transducer with metallopeptidase domain
MSAIESLVRQPAAQAIGWALLHFVWQGALIGVLTAAALAVLRRSAADVRYVVSTIALSLMLTLPAVTAAQLWQSTSVTGGSLSSEAAKTRSAPVARAPHDADTTVVRPDVPVAKTSRASQGGIPALQIESWLPVVVLAWVCGVVVLSLRLMSGWLWVQRMKSHGTAPAGDAWEHLAARLSRRLHIARRVRLLESTLVDVPTVIGWIKPVILLPASALSGLAPHQLEAILAHELAHIRRHDYLVNLLQTLVETLLFYHPAVWWLSRRIRAERENCCDDLAVSLSGDPYTYAKALADLEELRGAKGLLVLAASGGSLVHRVRRLLGAPTHAGRAPGWLAGTASVLVMFGIAAGAVGTDALQTAQTRASTPAVGEPAKPGVDNPAPQQQLAEEAQAVTAAAEDMARRAHALRQAGRVATAIQDATHQATTPFLAGQTLVARAATFEEAALIMAAEADSRRLAAAELSEQLAAVPMLAHAGLSDSDIQTSQALSASNTARASTMTAFASVAAIALGGGPQSHGTMSWSNNGERMEVRFDGEAEFSDDDADVSKMSPGGLLRIKEGGMLGGFFASHTVEVTADGSGNITRRFWTGWSERPFDPEGRQWLARYLPRFIRQTGFGARARVARILKAKGPAGVLAEISLIEGSWGKKTYFTELLKTATLDAATVRQVLTQAGREIDSDFELASLLIDSADKLLVDDGTRQAYFEAARTIQSDFEMARVYKSALKRGPTSSPLLAAILDASRGIDSDFEEATLLVQVARLQPLDNITRAPFFSALGTVESDFEHARVLKALSERTDLGPDTTAAMVTSGAAVSSDFEAASFLLQVVKQYPVEGALRAPFFRAVESIDSSVERGRVLKAVPQRSDVSADTLLAVIRATAAMNGSSFVASQVLLAAAAAQPIAGPARDAYIDAAEKLGDFEQGKVLAALVRSERRAR